jgi:hypothetical protein
MKTYENDNFVIGSTNDAAGKTYYHILWLDTGAKTCGYNSMIGAINAGDEICTKAELKEAD